MLLSGHKDKPVVIPLDRDEVDALVAELQATSLEKSVQDQRITGPNHV